MQLLSENEGQLMKENVVNSVYCIKVVPSQIPIFFNKRIVAECMRIFSDCTAEKVEDECTKWREEQAHYWMADTHCFAASDQEYAILQKRVLRQIALLTAEFWVRLEGSAYIFPDQNTILGSTVWNKIDPPMPESFKRFEFSVVSEKDEIMFEDLVNAIGRGGNSVGDKRIVMCDSSSFIFARRILLKHNINPGRITFE